MSAPETLPATLRWSSLLAELSVGVGSRSPPESDPDSLPDISRVSPSNISYTPLVLSIQWVVGRNFLDSDVPNNDARLDSVRPQKLIG